MRPVMFRNIARFLYCLYRARFSGDLFSGSGIGRYSSCLRTSRAPATQRLTSCQPGKASEYSARGMKFGMGGLRK
ncbi:hypothetical protein D3C71_1932870 [compost metagenome]